MVRGTCRHDHTAPTSRCERTTHFLDSVLRLSSSILQPAARAEGFIHRFVPTFSDVWNFGLRTANTGHFA